MFFVASRLNNVVGMRLCIVVVVVVVVVVEICAMPVTCTSMYQRCDIHAFCGSMLEVLL